AVAEPAELQRAVRTVAHAQPAAQAGAEEVALVERAGRTHRAGRSRGGLRGVEPRAERKQASPAGSAGGVAQETPAVDGLGLVAHGDGHTRPAARQARTTLTAHFLKSVSLEIGQVASSVSLLTSFDSSKKGTKINPTGGLLRPRVSTRADISPRRDCTLHSMPRC